MEENVRIGWDLRLPEIGLTVAVLGTVFFLFNGGRFLPEGVEIGDIAQSLVLSVRDAFGEANDDGSVSRFRGNAEDSAAIAAKFGKVVANSGIDGRRPGG